VIATQQLGQLGRHGPRFNAKIWMDFEGLTSGTQQFTDRGTGRSVWVKLGTDIELANDVAAPAGKTWLKAFNAAHALETDAVSANMLPATADWDLKFYVRMTAVTSRYMLSVQDGTPTAAGTQFAIATNGSGVPLVVLSDGATRSTIVTAPSAMSTNTTYAIVVSRRGSTISMTRDGSAYGSGTFAGSINQPAGRKWRISRPEFSSTVGLSTGYIDALRLVVL
jgi:hypothetical protein